MHITVPSPEEIAKEKQWIEGQIQEIGEETIQKLIQETIEAQKTSYSPYSHYAVGATVLSETGKMYRGNNAETVNYSINTHGEGSAINNALIHGEALNKRKFIKAICFVTNDNDIGPCGQCRQHIAEHCDNCLIISIDREGKIGLLSSLKILMPYPFTPTKLGIK